MTEIQKLRESAEKYASQLGNSYKEVKNYKMQNEKINEEIIKRTNYKNGIQKNIDELNKQLDGINQYNLYGGNKIKESILEARDEFVKFKNKVERELEDLQKEHAKNSDIIKELSKQDEKALRMLNKISELCEENIEDIKNDNKQYKEDLEPIIKRYGEVQKELSELHEYEKEDLLTKKDEDRKESLEKEKQELVNKYGKLVPDLGKEILKKCLEGNKDREQVNKSNEEIVELSKELKEEIKECFEIYERRKETNETIEDKKETEIINEPDHIKYNFMYSPYEMNNKQPEPYNSIYPTYYEINNKQPEQKTEEVIEPINDIDIPISNENKDEKLNKNTNYNTYNYHAIPNTNIDNKQTKNTINEYKENVIDTTNDINIDIPILEEQTPISKENTTQNNQKDIYTQVKQYAEQEPEINTPKLQRKFNLGYMEASKLLERLKQEGIVNFNGVYKPLKKVEKQQTAVEQQDDKKVTDTIDFPEMPKNDIYNIDIDINPKKKKQSEPINNTQEQPSELQQNTQEKTNSEHDIVINDYLRFIKKGSTTEEIDKKVKRNVSKEHKDGLLKRAYDNLRYFFVATEVIEEKERKKAEKEANKNGGRTR